MWHTPPSDHSIHQNNIPSKQETRDTAAHFHPTVLTNTDIIAQPLSLAPSSRSSLDVRGKGSQLMCTAFATSYPDTPVALSDLAVY